MDIFAWSYEDIKTYNTNIIQHKIPLNPNTKPFRQNLRRLNPTLLPIIGKEVNIRGNFNSKWASLGK